jgi:hypothetical protein
VAYEPEQWKDFFLTVGGGSAALAGLVVVAISIRLNVMTEDPVLRHRARMVLVGFTTGFLRCSLALIGGNPARGVAIGLFIPCLVVMIINFASYTPVSRLATPHTSSWARMIGGSVCYGVEMIGAGLLFFGAAWGLALAAVAMVANFAIMVSGSWLLLLGVREDEPSSQ